MGNSCAHLKHALPHVLKPCYSECILTCTAWYPPRAKVAMYIGFHSWTTTCVFLQYTSLQRNQTSLLLSKKYKAWAENITRQQIGILHDDKGGKYVSGNLDRCLTNAGIWQEHSICDTPQQLRVAKQLNWTLAEGITTALSQSGLTQTW